MDSTIYPGSSGWPYTLSPHDSGMLIEDVWPTLFFGRESIAEIKRKTNSLPWAASALKQMKEEAEAVMVRAPGLPIERVGWRHDFYSHVTAEHLLYDPESPHRYFDPLDGTFHNSPEQRAAWVLLTHERIFRIMRSLGFLYRLTGDKRYSDWVADGMMQAVRMFSRSDLRNKELDDALYFSALYDAQVLLLLSAAYDLTRESGSYSDEDRARIVSDIFESSIPYQIQFFKKTGVHNMTCYVGTAIAAVGKLLERSEWIEMGLNHPNRGLKAFLLNGLREDADGRVDGFWVEGTQFYHFYTLCPLLTLFEMGKNEDPCVMKLKDRLEAMFRAPYLMSDPEFRLYCVGDLGAPKVMNIRLYRHLYEYAAGQLDENYYSPILDEIYSQGIPRSSLAALAYGPDEITGRTPLVHQPSVHMKTLGMAVFRGDRKGKACQLWFRCGRHGMGHDHPDKLSIGISAMGEIISTDLGTAGYALRDLYNYYRSTLSHNTLLVDEVDQEKVEQALLEYADKPFMHARGAIEDAYEGVTLERKVKFDPPYILLQDSFSSNEPHRCGWVFHAYGSLSVRADSECSPIDMPGMPEDGPYSFFINRHTLTTEGSVCADWRVTDRVWLRLLVKSDGPFECTAGRTPGNPEPDDRGTVFLRALGKERRFYASLEIHTGVPGLAGLDQSRFDW
jgi:hypothetical protein